MHEETMKDFPFRRPGAPPVASPEEVIRLRKNGVSARETGEQLGITTRRVQQITAEWIKKEKTKEPGSSTPEAPAQSPEAEAQECPLKDTPNASPTNQGGS